MKDKLKAKLKSYGFWVSLASAVMVFLNTLGLKVDIPYLSQVTTAFLSILVIAGILTKPGDGGSNNRRRAVGTNRRTTRGGIGAPRRATRSAETRTTRRRATRSAEPRTTRRRANRSAETRATRRRTTRSAEPRTTRRASYCGTFATRAKRTGTYCGTRASSTCNPCRNLRGTPCGKFRQLIRKNKSVHRNKRLIRGEAEP